MKGAQEGLKGPTCEKANKKLVTKPFQWPGNPAARPPFQKVVVSKSGTRLYEEEFDTFSLYDPYDFNYHFKTSDVLLQQDIVDGIIGKRI